MSTIYSSKVAEIKDQLDEVIASMNSIYDNNDIDIDSLKSDFRNDDTIIFFASTDDDYAAALSDATYAKIACYVQAGLLSMKDTGDGKFNKLLSHKVSLLKDIDDKNVNKELESISKDVDELVEKLDAEVKKKEEAEKTRVKIIDETSEVETKEVDKVSDPEPQEQPKKRKGIIGGLDTFYSKFSSKVKPSNDAPKLFDEYGVYIGDVVDSDSDELFTKEFVEDIIRSSISSIRKNSKHADVIDKIDDDILEMYQNISSSKIGSFAIEQLCNILNKAVSTVEMCDTSTIKEYVDGILNQVNKPEDEKRKVSKRILSLVKLMKHFDLTQESVKGLIIDNLIENIVVDKIDEKIDSYENTDDIINAIAGMKQGVLDSIKEANTEMENLKNQLMSLATELKADIASGSKDSIVDKAKDKLSKLFNFNKEEVKEDDFDTTSKFIPQDEGKKEAVNFGGKPLLDYNKMTINESDKEAEDVTKTFARTMNRIDNKLSELIDKDLYKYSLVPMDNGTINLVMINNSNVRYTHIIDPGVVVGRGGFICSFKDRMHISLEEKAIVKRLLNNPNTFVLTDEERKTCESYLFDHDYLCLYDLIDLKGTSANIRAAIKKLNNDSYHKLGENLFNSYTKALLPTVNMQVRTRFIEFKDEDHFTLISDNNVKNVMNVDIGLTKEPTKIIYDNDKVTININDGVIIKEYKL